MSPSRNSTLGQHLRSIRELRGWSLHAAARKAGMSPAYVQKLERGQVAAPSPHKLQALANAYDVPYSELMHLAGYAPSTDGAAATRGPGGLLAQALFAEDVTEDEVEDLISYLRWRRGEKRRRSA